MSSYSDYPPPLPPILPRPNHNRSLSNLSSNSNSSSSNSKFSTSNTTTGTSNTSQSNNSQFSPTRQNVSQQQQQQGGKMMMRNPSLNEYSLNNNHNSNNNASPSRSRPSSPEYSTSNSSIRHASISPTSLTTTKRPPLVQQGSSGSGGGNPNSYTNSLSESIATSTGRPYGSPSPIVKNVPLPSNSSNSPSHSRLGSVSSSHKQHTFGGNLVGGVESIESSPFSRKDLQLPSPPNTLDGNNPTNEVGYSNQNQNYSSNSRNVSGESRIGGGGGGDTNSDPPTPWTPTRKRNFPLPDESSSSASSHSNSNVDSTSSPMRSTQSQSSSHSQSYSNSIPHPHPSVILDYGGDPNPSSSSHSNNKRSNSISSNTSTSTFTPTTTNTNTTQPLHHRRSSSNLIRKGRLPSLDLSGSLYNASNSSNSSQSQSQFSEGPLSAALPSSGNSSAVSPSHNNTESTEPSPSGGRTLRLSHSFSSSVTTTKAGNSGAGGDDSFEGEDTEARRVRRSKRAAEVKEKNQRILDSINSQNAPPPAITSPTFSESSLHYHQLQNQTSISPSDDLTSTTLRDFLSSNDNTPTEESSNGTLGLGGVGRSRSPALHRVPSLSLRLSEGSNSESASGSGSNSTTSNLTRTVRPRASMSEIGRYEDSSTTSNGRRKVSDSSNGAQVYSSTGQSNLDREKERERRVRTLGMGNTVGSEGIERSSTAMSSASNSANSTRRKTDWLDREYEKSKGITSTSSGTSRGANGVDDNFTINRRRSRVEIGDRSISPSISMYEEGEIRRSPNLNKSRPSLPTEFTSIPSTNSPKSEKERILSLTTSTRPQSSLSPRLNHSSLLSSASSRTTPPSISTRDSNSTRRGLTPEPGSTSSSTRRWANNQSDSLSLSTTTNQMQDEQNITPTASSNSPWSSKVNVDRRESLTNSLSAGNNSLGVPSRFEGDGLEVGAGGGIESSQRALSRTRSSARLRNQMSEAQAAEAIRIEKEDVFRNGLRYLDDKERDESIDDRFHIDEPSSSSIRRGSRTKESEIGSDNWLQDFHDNRQRNAISRASAVTDDSHSHSRSINQLPLPPPSNIQDRDGTIRAINAVLAAQGLVVAVAPQSLSPVKLTSRNIESESIRRRAMSNDFLLDSPASSSGGAFGRPISRAESNRSNTRSGIGSGSTAEHHRLLQQALDHLDSHFTNSNFSDAGENLLPESVDLIKRMTGLVNSTTKLNSGLRALSIAATEAQIDAALDEGRRSSISELVQFEKSVNYLVRSSDDQVRSLTEGLIVFTKVDREKERLRSDLGMASGGELIRPGSRTSGTISKRGNYSPKRQTPNSGVFEGGAATVSTSATRSLATNSPRQTLRNPLTPLDEPRVRRTTNLSVSSQSPRSPFTGSDSPTPNSTTTSRRQLESTLSPLSNQERESTPTRITPGLSSTLSSERLSAASAARRSKSSAASNLVTRSITPTTTTTSSIHQPTRFPRTSNHGTAPILDTSNVIMGNSPTKLSTSRFEPIIPIPRYRTYSEADRATYEALGIDTQGTERSEKDWNYHHSLTNNSAIESESGGSSPEVGRSGGFNSSRRRVSNANTTATLGFTRGGGVIERISSPEIERRSDYSSRRELSNNVSNSGGSSNRRVASSK